MNVNNRIPDGNGHLTIKSITEWISGECTANLELEYEQHCVRCAECREQVAMISQSMQPDEEIVRSTEFQQMLRIGEDVALRVWKEQRELAEPEPEPIVSKPEKKSWLERLIPARQPSLRPAEVLVSPRQESLVQYIWGQPALRLATIAILLMAAGIPGFLYWQNNQPVNRSMASLRQAWDRNRPIETRVTGDFPYLPYIVTRGPGDTISVNQAQLLAATADLAREVADRPTPRAKHALGRLHLLKAEFDEAEKLLKEVINEEPKNAQAHVDLASVYYEQGVKSESPQLFFQTARNLQTATEISPKLAEAWFNLALCHERMLLFTDAKKDWGKYLELDASSRWADEARDRLQKLQQRSILREPQPEKVAAELRSVFAAKDEAALRRLLEDNFTVVTELTSGRLMDDYLNAAIEGKRVETDKHHQLLQRLAELIRDTKGDHYFADLLRFVENSSPDRLGKIRLLREHLQLGRANFEAGLYKQAIKFATTAKDKAESITDGCHTEAAMYDIARIYTPQTETKEMPLLRLRLLSETIRQRHQQMQAKVLLALANQYGAARSLSSCLEASLQAREISSRLNDTDQIVAALRFIGVVYSNLGEQEQWLNAHYWSMHKLWTSPVSLRRTCQTYADFANSLSNFGYYREAQEYQREALRFCLPSNPSVYLPAIWRAGKYAALAGQLDESLRLFQQSLKDAKHLSQTSGTQILEVDLYLSLGDALMQSQRFIEAELAYKQAREKLGQVKHLKYLSAIQNGLGAAFLPQGKIRESEAALNKSFELTELSRLSVNVATGRNTFVSSQLNVYQSMVQFQYLYRHSPERAFDFSEIYRNRELLDLVAQTREGRLEGKGKDLKLASTTQPLTISQIQAKLPMGTQLVEYAITEKHLLIWVLNRDGWLTESVAATPAQLQEMVTDYLQAVREQRKLTALNTQAKKLYQLLIQPVAGHLRPQNNLVIIPDGVLSSLPFVALVNPETQRYLLEDYTLTISPSASILVELLERSGNYGHTAIKSLLAVNNPAFDYRLFPKLARLSDAEQEMRELPLLYGQYEVLKGSQATKERFLQRAGKFAVLHVGAHSLVNAREPLLSAVVLAAAEKGESHRPQTAQTAQTESLLAAHEIFRMRLPQTRLVILSSCDSLTSQTSGHNGLGGLAHAFFSAGVPTVIGSLWEVEDYSSAKLMAAFHQNWRLAKLSTSQSLRKAQLDFLHSDKESQRHPFFWAAFQVSGDGITI